MTQPVSGYTSDEIQSSVQSLVQTSVRRQVSPLGTRQTDVTFTGLQQAAVGIFVLYPVSLFYVISLGVSRLDELLNDQIANVQQLQSFIQNAGRIVLPVTNLTPLSNANAALFSLQGAVSSRSSAFGSVSSTPAFQRFASNVQTFLNENGPNIKSGGAIVPTPHESKDSLGTLLSTISAAQQEIIQLAGYLANALNDYLSMNLPVAAAGSAIQNASQSIAVLHSNLQSQTPSQRLISLRSTVLTLLAAKAVVQQVGSFVVPGSLLPVLGTGAPYADATHPATPAVLAAQLYAPYNISTSPAVTITMDGGPVINGNLNNALFAELYGTKLEPFTFVAAAAAIIHGTVADLYTIATGVNDTLYLTMRDPVSGAFLPVTLLIGAGAGVSATLVAGSLQTALATNYPGLSAHYAIVASADTHHIDIEAIAVGSQYAVTIGGGDICPTLGFTLGTASFGVDLNYALHLEETTTPTHYDMDFTPGTYTAVQVATAITLALGPDIIASAQGSAGFQFVNVRYVGSTPPIFEANLQFTTPVINNPAATVLGFSIGIPIGAKAATARQVAKNFNQLTPSINVTVQVDPISTGANVLMRGEPTDPTRVVVYKVTNQSGVATTTGPNSLTVSGAGLLEAGIVDTDVLVIRSGTNTNTLWNITAVTDTLITATGLSTPVTGPCTYEVGPALVGVLPGYVVQVPGAGVNNGIYTITQQGPTILAVPFELEIAASLPSFVLGTGLPSLFTGNVGQEKPVFASSNTTTASAVTIGGAAAALFFTTPPGTAVGTTPWVKLPQVVNNLAAGDVLERFITRYNIPDDVYRVTAVQGTTIGITPDIEDNATLNFVTDVQPPFADLRSGAYASYEALSSQLTAWLKLPQNQASYFQNLQRLVNIVIQEPQSTPSQINTALAWSTQLSNILGKSGSTQPTSTIEYSLLNYSVARVSSIDDLIKTYAAQGAQRAIDILVQGQFSAFFGLDQDGVSYAGAMLSQIRTVALNDLPIKKTDRISTVLSPVTGSTQSPDFEYDASDIDKGPTPNVPTNFEQVSSTEHN